jgi:hypothetical protein
LSMMGVGFGRKDVVSNFRTLILETGRDRWSRESWEGISGSEKPERIPDGATMGIEYSTYCSGPTRYLQGRLKLARDQFGVTIIIKKIPRAPEGQLYFVVDEAKKILLNKLNKHSEVIRAAWVPEHPK